MNKATTDMYLSALGIRKRMKKVVREFKASPIQAPFKDDLLHRVDTADKALEMLALPRGPFGTEEERECLVFFSFINLASCSQQWKREDFDTNMPPVDKVMTLLYEQNVLTQPHLTMKGLQDMYSNGRVLATGI